MEFKVILTNYGITRLAQAIATNTPVQLTKMAVGDGGGVLPVPNPARTTLIGEKYRAPLNTLFVDPTTSTQVVAEMVMDAAQGGYWIRECGLYDADNKLFAIGNVPETYKPILASGSGRTLMLRMVMAVNNAAAITLIIDPSVVLASRKYVDELMAAHEKSVNHPSATTVTKGFVQLVDSASGESTSLVPTQKAVSDAIAATNKKMDTDFLRQDKNLSDVRSKSTSVANLGLAGIAVSVASGSNTGATSSAGGNSGVAIGDKSNASGYNTTALGCNAKASDISSVALGNTASATSSCAIAIGVYSVSSGVNTLSMGYYAACGGQNSTAIGPNASATSTDSVAIGRSAKTTGNTTIAIGYYPLASGENALALGSGVTAAGIASIALGYSAKATYKHAIALHGWAEAAGAIAIGRGAEGPARATGTGSIAMGNGGDTAGWGTQATGPGSIAIGSATASAAGTVLPSFSPVLASGDYAIAIGGGSPNTDNMLRITTQATYPFSVALGAGSIVFRAEEVSIGQGQLMGSAPKTRFLANVRAAEKPTDAINLEQFTALELKLKALLLCPHKVGYVLFKASGTSPAQDYPGTTWAQLPPDVMIRTANAAGNNIGITSGQDSVTLSINEMPEHSHDLLGYAPNAAPGNGMLTNFTVDSSVTSISKQVIKNSGGGKSFSIINRHVVIIAWERVT